MKYQYLLFDADGTLFDFEMSEKIALKETLESAGIRFSQELLETYITINKSYWRKFEQGSISKPDLLRHRFRDLLDSIGRQDLQADELNTGYLDHLGDNGFLFPGAEDLCRNLSREYTLLLVTNGVYKTQLNRFNRSPVKPYFKEMIVSEKVGYAKPDPRYFDYVFQSCSISEKSRALMIGDSLTADIKGGRDYGIDTCFYNPAGNPAEPGLCTYEIRTFSGLYEILDRK